MTHQADAPLRKLTLNFYESDIEFIKQYYGQGWTEYIRDLLKAHVRMIKEANSDD